MKTILHYSVGFNSDRGGGLTRYSDDLMFAQQKDNKVILLYPGEMSLLNSKQKIIKCKPRNGIENYRIINPLPVLFMCGLKNERYLNERSDINLWINFFKRINPDIFHVHSLVGINEECINAAKALNIPIIYTTHDYFGICPKQTLLFHNTICTEGDNCANCPECNRNALSNFKTYLLHSKLFPRIRHMKLIIKLKNKVKNEQNVKDGDINANFKYDLLKEKYDNIFKNIDYFHFNSTLTKEVFETRLKFHLKGQVIPISHSGISDNRVIKDYSHKTLKMVYLGSSQPYKGFPFLIGILDEIYQEDKNFSLTVFCGNYIQREYLNVVSDGYKFNQLKDIFSDADVLLVPSQWYETFALVVIEAMSFGVPVIVNENVGAKDVIRNGENGLIVESPFWKDAITSLIKDKHQLSKYNQCITNSRFFTFDKHVGKMIEMYDSVIEERKRFMSKDGSICK